MSYLARARSHRKPETGNVCMDCEQDAHDLPVNAEWIYRTSWGGSTCERTGLKYAGRWEGIDTWYADDFPDIRVCWAYNVQDSDLPMVDASIWGSDALVSKVKESVKQADDGANSTVHHICIPTNRLEDFGLNPPPTYVDMPMQAENDLYYSGNDEPPIRHSSLDDEGICELCSCVEDDDGGDSHGWVNELTTCRPGMECVGTILGIDTFVMRHEKDAPATVRLVYANTSDEVFWLRALFESATAFEFAVYTAIARRDGVYPDFIEVTPAAWKFLAEALDQEMAKRNGVFGDEAKAAAAPDDLVHLVFEETGRTCLNCGVELTPRSLLTNTTTNRTCGTPKEVGTFEGLKVYSVPECRNLGYAAFVSTRDSAAEPREFSLGITVSEVRSSLARIRADGRSPHHIFGGPNWAHAFMAELAGASAPAAEPVATLNEAYALAEKRLAEYLAAQKREVLPDAVGTAVNDPNCVMGPGCPVCSGAVARLAVAR